MNQRSSLPLDSSVRPPPRLRSPQRQQVLTALTLDNLLESDHQARLVWDFCLGLDLSALYEAIRSRAGGPGRAALDPRLGVAWWLYATREGVGSARALDDRCNRHHAFRWLCGGVSVNYHSLADFRTGPVAVLDRTRTHSVAVLRQHDLVDRNRVAQDGRRVRASAGAASLRRRPTLAECLREATDQVARLKEERDDDPSAPSRRHAAARQRAARERRERLEQALRRLPELEARKPAREKSEARCSTTDPQATVLKRSDGGYRPADNVQYAADGRNRVIVGVDVLSTGSDQGRWPPLGEQVHDRHGQYPCEQWAAGGFAKREDIEPAQTPPRGTTVSVPVPEPKDKGRDRYAPWPTDRAAVAEWRVRMGTEAAKAIDKDRASTAECVNAPARNRGWWRLLVRGLEKVTAVASCFHPFATRVLVSGE